MTTKTQSTEERKEISLNEYYKWSNEFYQKTFLHFTLIAGFVAIIMSIF